ncbi:Gluconate 2-dehydrogenase subunit 3-like protein [Vibrio crassostreae]|nr:Gluconate 2-dehydrogenase subunit 3-like protein [Vibrio crassostreae]
MKTVLPLLLLTCASVQAQAQPRSPELTQLLSEIHEQYDTATLAMPKRAMADITKLPYFLQHIDETDTVGSIRLNAYLQGLHTAYFGSANHQKRLGGGSWFCMRDTMALDPNRHPEFLKDMIWLVLEKTAKNDPQKFRRDNFASAFMVSTEYIFEYGLQTEYPCYSPIPKSLQLNGWKY